MNQSRRVHHSLLVGQETRPHCLCPPSTLYGTVTQYKEPRGQASIPYPQDATGGSRCQSCPTWHCKHTHTR